VRFPAEIERGTGGCRMLQGTGGGAGPSHAAVQQQKVVIGAVRASLLYATALGLYLDARLGTCGVWEHSLNASSRPSERAAHHTVKFVTFRKVHFEEDKKDQPWCFASECVTNHYAKATGECRPDTVERTETHWMFSIIS
jgi:hypothetical protein